MDLLAFIIGLIIDFVVFGCIFMFFIWVFGYRVVKQEKIRGRN